MLTLYLKECQNWVNGVIARRQKGIFAEEDGSMTMFDLLLEAKPSKDYKVASHRRIIPLPRRWS